MILIAPIAAARRGVEISRLIRIEQGGLTYWTAQEHDGERSSRGVHLLPIYDEYLVAYRDRLAVPHGAGGTPRLSVTFRHALVIDGQVAGTWTVRRAPGPPAVHVTPLRRLTKRERELTAAAVQRYASFLRTPLQLGFPPASDPV